MIHAHSHKALDDDCRGHSAPKILPSYMTSNDSLYGPGEAIQKRDAFSIAMSKKHNTRRSLQGENSSNSILPLYLS